MARNKDKFADKLGMVYIIFIIAVPSLAYIYLFRYLGTTLFNLPSVFTTYGPGDVRSWILPIISLALPSIASLMLWTRRYVVDQMNSDYVKFAKAKGLNQREIFSGHIFKNAVIPIAQGIPASLAASSSPRYRCCRCWRATLFSRRSIRVFRSARRQGGRK